MKKLKNEIINNILTEKKNYTINHKLFICNIKKFKLFKGNFKFF